MTQSTPAPAPAPGSDARWPSVACAAVLLAMVMVWAFIPIAPELHWDMDPRAQMQYGGVLMFGPTGALVWAALACLVAGAALAAHLRSGGRLDGCSLLLALAGAGAAAVHLRGSVDAVMRCAMWIASVSLAVALLHVARDRRAQQFIVAILVALLIPLAIGAVWYVAVEHPQTVAQFDAHEAEFLASRGWPPGSAMHLSYRRRLEQADAVGAFGLSNVFGSIIAGLTLAAAALALGAWTDRQVRNALLATALFMVGAVTLYLTRSRGALLAAALAGTLLLMVWGCERWSGGRWSIACRRWRSPAAMVLLALPLGAVLLRGALGPPATVQGERSLLFRYHYWAGAARVIEEARPVRWLAGVGPEGFHDRYPQVKNPLNPEEVESTHNVFIDFITMLGLGGAAWSALLLLWLWRAGRPAAETPPEPPPGDNTAAGQIALDDVAWPALFVVIVFGCQYAVRQAVMTPEATLLWLAGAAAVVVVAAVAAGARAFSLRWVNVGLFVAALALLVHNQIEMTFHAWGAAPIAWAIVAIAAARPAAPPTAERRPQPRALRAGVPAVLVLAGIALAFFVTAPVVQQQGALADAGDALRRGDIDTAVLRLEAAADAWPSDSRPRLHQARLYAERGDRLAQQGELTQARGEYDRAVQALDGGGDDEVAQLRLRAQILTHAADTLDEPDRLEQAARWWHKATELNPHSLEDHLSYGDTLWRLERYEQAQRVYQRVLEIDRQSYLDPLRQLDARRRALAEQRAQGRPVNGIGGP